MRFSYDASILFYSADRDAGRRYAMATDLVDRAMQADCILTLQSLAEFFHAVTRKGKRTPADAAGFIADWRAVFPVHAADDACLADAIDAVRQNRISFWDAMLWAVVRQARCTLLLSEDMQDGRRFGGLTIVNPFRPENAALIDRILPP